MTYKYCDKFWTFSSGYSTGRMNGATQRQYHTYYFTIEKEIEIR